MFTEFTKYNKFSLYSISRYVVQVRTDCFTRGRLKERRKFTRHKTEHFIKMIVDSDQAVFRSCPPARPPCCPWPRWLWRPPSTPPSPSPSRGSSPLRGGSIGTRKGTQYFGHFMYTFLAKIGYHSYIFAAGSPLFNILISLKKYSI